MDKQEKLRKIMEILKKHGIDDVVKLSDDGNAVVGTSLYRTKSGWVADINRFAVGFDENGNFFYCITVEGWSLEGIRKLCELREELLEIIEEIKRTINET